ncbi:MAG: SDR family NAD(P)-dependent oxidoreductase [Candidatus Staskawiczbacteria bacterium]|nr:SDR family NAD(P)-dependent oxidoreductase [Candidatus Staskawiczbacteria bacterium]
MFGLNKTLPKFCDLKGKVAIVTGAAKGMGKAHSLTLSKAGAKVALADIDLAGCQLVVDEIKKQRGESFAVKCDMSQKKDIDNLIAETVKKFGKIDILVNNAGIFPFKPFLEMQEQDFEKVIDVNLKGYFLAAQAATKEMQKNQPNEKGQRGSIINIASIAAIVGFPGLVHYCGSKGGIIGMSKAMALELAPLGIRVNNVDPGAIDTPGASMTNMDPKAREAMLAPIPMKRSGTAQEIANAVLFLASNESSYLTGSTMVVDGGWVAG